MDYTKETKHIVGAEKLLQTMIDPEYIIALAKEYKAIECKVEEVERIGNKLVQKIFKRELSRQSNQEEDSTETREWNLADKSCKWTRTPPKGSPPGLVTIAGGYKIMGDDNSSTLVSTGTIEIKIPIMGKKIAEKIVNKIVNDDGKFERFTNEYLKSK